GDGTFLARLPLPHRSSYHGGVGCVAFSSDGKLLAAAGWDETIRGWEMATGQIVFRFRAEPVTRQSLAFSADGRRLASGHCDSTVLIWTLNPLERTAPARETKLSAREMEQLWSDLCEKGPRTGYRALWRLVSAPDAAVAFLGERLGEAAAPVGPERMEAAIRRLSHPEFRTRQEASELLRQCGSAAEPALRATLKTTRSAETRGRIRALLEELADPFRSTAGSLRHGRAIQALELIGSEKARAVLQELAARRDPTPLSREAAAAIKRLRGRLAGTAAASPTAESR
ncbi:MAG: hypothetical protein WBF17_12920, partial [Phycisphaerae bacterium]